MTVGTLAVRGPALPRYRIPISRPPYLPESEVRIGQALRDGFLGGYGEPNRSAEQFLTSLYGRPVLLLSSGTHALEVAAMLLGIRPGDEVIVPSYGYVTTANAFVVHGARPRFADCDSHGNLDLESIGRLINPRTRAVVPIHYGGASGDIARLAALCSARGVLLVEDAAQTIGATFEGKPLGTFGAVGCLSFDSMKNVTAGQGGAIIVSDDSLLTDAHRIRDRGTNQREFQLGRVEEYCWTGPGSNYSLSDLNAALLLPQLEQLDRINGRRAALWRRYEEALGPATRDTGAYTLGIDSRVRSSHHIFAIVWPDRQLRDEYIQYMAEDGIQTPFHYPALHRSPFGRTFVDPADNLPNSERLADGLVRLPLYDALTESDQDDVIGRTLSFFNSRFR